MCYSLFVQLNICWKVISRLVNKEHVYFSLSFVSSADFLCVDVIENVGEHLITPLYLNIKFKFITFEKACRPEFYSILFHKGSIQGIASAEICSNIGLSTVIDLFEKLTHLIC